MASYRRHQEQAPLEVRAVEMPAECYNCARLALLRDGGDSDDGDGAAPVWLSLPGLGSLKLALMPDAWVVADLRLGQAPLMAWSDFCPAADRALHEAVPCGLRTYTGAADRILPSVEPVMLRQLRAVVAGNAEGAVLLFPPRR